MKKTILILEDDEHFKSRHCFFFREQRLSNSIREKYKRSCLANLWDHAGNFVDENTLPVNISRLRAKIEEDPKIRRMETPSFL